MRLRRREWAVLAVLLALALVALVNFKQVQVSGISMEPTFHDGDRVIIWKRAPYDQLKPGDIIVFKSGDGSELIKRIVCVAPATRVRQFPPANFPRSIPTPNGLLDPRYGFFPYFFAVSIGRKPLPPPQDTIYVMGDNYKHSLDSRDFGPIDPHQILGKVIHGGTP